MLLAAIILFFSALALVMLALLDRYQSAMDKAHVVRRMNRPEQHIYYDAFAGRRPARVQRETDDSQRAA